MKSLLLNRAVWSRALLIAVALTLISLLFIVPIAYAQDIPPAPAPALDPAAPLLELALGELLKGLSGIVTLAFAAPFVTALTGLLKRYIPPTISAGAISLTVNVVIWVGWVLALHFGIGDAFKSWITAATTILGALAGVGLTSMGATALYYKAAALDVPMAGYVRLGSAHPNVVLARMQRAQSISTTVQSAVTMNRGLAAWLAGSKVA